MPPGKIQGNPAELPLEGAGPSSPAMRLTPAMAQYFEAKRQHPDALLFFRIGDFYELFFDDALKAAPLLEIALTTRDKNKGEDAVPMCGVPHHAAETYIRRLTDRGIKVAICDQVEDPSKAKGIVRREIVRLVTPGMPLEEEGSQRRDRYVLALHLGKQGRLGLAAVDAATGAFPVAEVSEQELASELARLAPAEIVFAEGVELPPSASEFLKTHAVVPTSRAPLDFRSDRAEGLLKDHFGLGSLQGFGLSPGSPALAAAGALLSYVRDAGKAGATHVRELHPYRPGGSLVLDESTLANLEIFAAQGGREERGALVGAIDRTVSAAGARLLRRWLLYPLVEVAGIEARQDAVEAFKENAPVREEARSVLGRSSDIERIAAKTCQGRASPRDLWALRCTLEEVPRIVKVLADSEKEVLSRRGKALPLLPDLLKEIREILVEEPPVDFGDSPVIRPGFSPELDSLREARAGGKEWIARLETKERERTGIGSLKVRYNRVFGYYIEITKANLGNVPSDYMRKQTLAGAERFVTPDLKEWEEKVLTADDRARSLEQEIFGGLSRKIAARAADLQTLARALAEIDALGSFAELASRGGYVRPKVHEGMEVVIREGRHPVVEQFLEGERFIPNDIEIGPGEILVITGPNMAGKSTVMRQVAIIALLAQVGSFVPASEVRIGLVDRIFTRVGASDNLARGLSTFMLEMTETAAILRQATPRSLILMDEIGRGTSTFDGLSIAWSVAEALHDHAGQGVRTLFATHYHELTDLSVVKARVKNFTMDVKEWGGRILFLRKLVPGAASRSYGIHVAQLAGIPEGVIKRAREVLSALESGEWDAGGQPRIAGSAGTDEKQLSLLADPRDRLLFELRQELESMDPNTMTPLEALSWLGKWKGRLSKG